MYKKIMVKKNKKDDGFVGFFEGFIIDFKSINRIKKIIKEKNSNEEFQEKFCKVVKENFSTAAVFKYMKIEEEYRGKSHGNDMLNEFLSICDENCVDFVFLVADNINDHITIDEHLDKKFSITKYYENYGFKKIRQLEKNTSLMIYPDVIADIIIKNLKD